jgi:hypothetical protein
VVTRAHERHYRDLLNEILPENLVIQPENRGTAPANFADRSGEFTAFRTGWRSRVNSNSRATFDWPDIIRKRAMALAPFRPQLTSKAILRSE